MARPPFPVELPQHGQPNDRRVGPTFENPHRFKNYVIYIDDGPGPYAYYYEHKDFDGPEDNRYGYGNTIAECEEEIDLKEMDNG